MADVAYREQLDVLTESEFRALRSAAAWYAKYHGPTISAESDERGALVETRREQYVDLLMALRKLGLPLLPPVGIDLQLDR